MSKVKQAQGPIAITSAQECARGEKNLQPHVQAEELGTSVGSRHIWLGQ